MDSGISTDALVFYAIAAFFVGFIIIGIAKTNSENRYSRPLPNRPEPLQKQQMPEVAGSFDSNALNTAKAMAMELERYPDPASRTLALAEMLHRTEQAKARQADRMYQQERKDADALDRVLGLVDRIMPRNAPQRPYPPMDWPQWPDPRARRINEWQDGRRIAEQEYWNGGYWK
ncbi:MAG: hypothetical protein R2941_24340 [Desulfobacterales bacterium]